VVSDPKPLTPLIHRELRGCFDFFWKEWISDPASPTCGMTSGDYVGLNKYSPIPVESQGFYFAAIAIGVERGWITREEGEKRVLITLNSLKNLQRINGFRYHFIDPQKWQTRLEELAAGRFFNNNIERKTDFAIRRAVSQEPLLRLESPLTKVSCAASLLGKVKSLIHL
jgi:hypothetical protein